MGYKNITFIGLGWMSFLQVVVKSLSLLRIAILAQFLTQFEIGLFSIVILLLGLLETFTEFGFGAFIIQKERNIHTYISNAFSVQILRGFLLGLLLLAIAFPASYYFKSPEVIPLILLGSIIPIIKSFENPYITIFQKELRFGKEFLLKSTSSLIEFLVIVFFVYTSGNAQSVIVAISVSSAVFVSMTWLFIQKKPTLRFQYKYISEIIRFARSISMLSIATYFVTQIDSFIIGRALGISSLGGYQVAQKFSYTPMQDASSVSGKVTFPVYSKLVADKKRLTVAFLKTLKGLLLIEFAFMVTVLLFADTILHYFAGPNYSYLGGTLRLLAIYGFVISSWGSIGALFFALKKQTVLLKITCIRLIVLIPLIVIGIKFYGTNGVVLALIVSMIVILLPSVRYVIKELR